MENLKVYIVDDEPLILEGLVKTYEWEQRGFTVAGYSVNPRKALSDIRVLEPDLVITDIRMRQMSGLDLIEAIKEMEKDILCIIISAYRDFSYAQRACELGAFTYLLKPLEEEKLYKALSAAREVCLQQKREQEILKRFETPEEGEEEQKEEPCRNAYVEEAVYYIKQHLQNEFLNITDVAAEVHLNSMYFGRLFKEDMKKSFKQYLLEERIKKARKLFEDTRYTVSEIAEKVGIPNSSYFTQQFKKQTGILPSEYRKGKEL